MLTSSTEGDARRAGGQVVTRVPAAAVRTLTRLLDPAPERPRDAEGAADQPFCGARRPLRRLATVRAGTVVVAWPDGDPVLRRSGELLVPPWPLQAAVEVMPVRTDPVELTVTVTGAVTLDGQPVDEVDVALSVTLVPDDDYAVALELAVEYGDQLGQELLSQVLRGVESGVRAAVRMNTLADLRRLSLDQVLKHQWLPAAFAGGRLRRRGFSVPRVSWPTADEDSLPSVGSPTVAGGVDRPPKGPVLSVDARLRRIWLAHSADEPLGIAGARVGDQATTIVVLPSRPSAYQTNRAREDLEIFFGTQELTVLAVSAVDYPALIRGWFAELGLRDRQVLAVESDEEEAELTIVVDRTLPRATASGWQGFEGSQLEALRRLLPFLSVRLVVAGSVE